MDISDDLICGICSQTKQAHYDHICIPVVISRIKQEVLDEEEGTEKEESNSLNSLPSNSDHEYQCQQSEIKVLTPKVEQPELQCESACGTGIINNGLNGYCSPQVINQNLTQLCQRCSEVFLSVGDLERHREITKISCHLCGLKFCSVNTVRKHLAIKHSKEKYLCHLYLNLSLTRPKCTLCREVFFNDTDLKKHIDIKKVRCHACNTVWCSFLAMKRHLDTCKPTILGEITKKHSLGQIQPGGCIVLRDSVNKANIVDATAPMHGSDENSFPITLTRVNPASNMELGNAIFGVTGGQMQSKVRQEVRFGEALKPDSVHADNTDAVVEMCSSIGNPLIKQEVNEKQENFISTFYQKNFTEP